MNGVTPECHSPEWKPKDLASKMHRHPQKIQAFRLNQQPRRGSKLRDATLFRASGEQKSGGRRAGLRGCRQLSSGGGNRSAAVVWKLSAPQTLDNKSLRVAEVGVMSSAKSSSTHRPALIRAEEASTSVPCVDSCRRGSPP